MTVDRSRLPDVGPTPSLRFPSVVRHRLSSGATLLTVEHRDVPVLALLTLVRAGSADDPPERSGLAALAADLLDEGAGARSSLEYHDALARIGGQIGIDPGPDATLAGLETLARHVDAGFELLADLVQRPRFEEPDFARVRDLRLNRLAQMRTLPAALAEQTFTGRLFGAHPYGHLAIGTDASLRAVSLDEVRTLHRQRYAPGQLTLVAVGDVSHDGLARAADRAFVAAAGSGDAPATDVNASPAPPSRARIVMVDRPGAPQSELRVGRVSTRRSSPDYHTLAVLNAALGGQFVSRINLNLREDKGYTYGARSGFDLRRGPGPFVVQASVQTSATAASLREVFAELDAIGTSRPVTAAELAMAQASLTRGFARGFETAEQIARAVTQLALYGLPDDFYDRYVDRINQVTADQVTAAARQWLPSSTMTAVVVGDLVAVAGHVAELGIEPIERVNTDLK